MPRTGVYTTKGVNMDKEGVLPDVVVETHPDQLAKGIDLQLDKAVEVLTEEVTAWKKKNQPNMAVKLPEKAGDPPVAPKGPITPPSPMGGPK